MRDIAWTVDDQKVQISAVTTLDMLDDDEGLRNIAEAPRWDGSSGRGKHLSVPSRGQNPPIVHRVQNDPNRLPNRRKIRNSLSGDDLPQERRGGYVRVMPATAARFRRVSLQSAAVCCPTLRDTATEPRYCSSIRCPSQSHGRPISSRPSRCRCNSNIQGWRSTMSNSRTPIRL